MEESNRISNLVSDFVFTTRTFGRRAIQSAMYHCLRQSSLLSSQQTLHALRKAADCYSRDKSRQHQFRQHGSIAYDSRILTIYPERQILSIRTLSGRECIRFSAGDHQLELLKHQYGESDLIYRSRKFYLQVSVTVTEEPVETPTEILGVDLGIVTIAADSDGTIYSGIHREEVRSYYNRRRTELQRHGTRSAKRRLRKLSTKQQNFQRNENHTIAKQIVTTASEGTKRAIALENLTGIRTRTTVSRKQRNRHTNWSFGQLRTFISYKAQRAGIRVFRVDPRNTSRGCPECGHIDKRNRPRRDTFRCRECLYEKHADITAAINISKRAAVNLPMVSMSLAR
jgi:IS605 OrfB family transposase